MSDLAGFGMMISALADKAGVGGSLFPKSDVDDFASGVTTIPGEVTDARRAGQEVRFVKNCGPCCWFWEFPDGKRIYHNHPPTYQSIGRRNFPDTWGDANLMAGPCPVCGNENTGGNTVT